MPGKPVKGIEDVPLPALRGQRLCHCKIVCKVPTWIARSTYRIHQKKVAEQAAAQDDQIGLPEGSGSDEEDRHKSKRRRTDQYQSDDEGDGIAKNRAGPEVAEGNDWTGGEADENARVGSDVEQNEMDEQDNGENRSNLAAYSGILPPLGFNERRESLAHEFAARIPIVEEPDRDLPPSPSMSPTPSDIESFGYRTPPRSPTPAQDDGDEFYLDDRHTPPPVPLPAPDPIPHEDPNDLSDIGDSQIDELHIQWEFIQALNHVTLEGTGLTDDQIKRLRNPPQCPASVTDPVIGRSLQIWISLDHAANVYYETVRCALASWKPYCQLLSLEEVKRYAQEISGISPLYTDMCPDGCVAYAGPFAELNACPKCGEARYRLVKGKQVHRKQMVTFPVGPQIQAAWRSPESAEEMKYRARATEDILDRMAESAGDFTVPAYSDIIHSTEYLTRCMDDEHPAPDAVPDDKILSTDTLLMFSIDGAQLYQMKQSDCWIYIWVLLDRSPETRYKNKHILIGGIIPGPKHPKHLESFVYAGFAHVAALMKEGLSIWDAATGEIFISKIFISWFTADTIGITPLSGFVGHTGKHGCRLYCLMPGRHKPGAGGHYYPACLKPAGEYTAQGSSHEDICLEDVVGVDSGVWAARYRANLNTVQTSQTTRQYELNQRETGIKKPSILLGFPPNRIFTIPSSLPGDLMHLGSPNTFELMMSLWRGTMTCTSPDHLDTWDWAVLRDAATWKHHGKIVEATTSHLPGSFDRPPRNIEQKINSGYKSKEMQTYLYGLGPAILYEVLPARYWRHFCKLVYGMRILHQYSISAAELQEAHDIILEYCTEFEELYYQRHPKRLHFCRQAVHALAHIATETRRTGPYALKSQWTMERIIGHLGGQIRQPSNPFANLIQRGTRHCQTAAIKHMLPEFDPDFRKPPFPQTAIGLGEGYVLLRYADRYPHRLGGYQARAMEAFVQREQVEVGQRWRRKGPRVRRWARLRLPTGQIARAWKEKTFAGNIRESRNVKIQLEGKSTMFAEVLFYFRMQVPNSDENTFAMVRPYSPPDSDLLKESSHTLWSCTPGDDESVIIVSVRAIKSVVAAIPHPEYTNNAIQARLRGRYYIVEKMGLDIGILTGAEEIDPEQVHA